MKERIAECINILGEFCGSRDIPALTREELHNTYGIMSADVMVLFGGSIMCGGDVLAEAMKRNIAKTYVIVGGEGHTTESLRRKVHSKYPDIETEGLREAKVFVSYLKYNYGLSPDFVECRSTNCGNNITFLLDLLNENHIAFKSIILTQDATMQLRMKAVLKKYVSAETRIINYASYAAKVVVNQGELVYEEEVPGMWDMERYITLLLGEIPRLTDDESGYGPKGKGFISHVEIPDEVRQAFFELEQEYKGMVREAKPLYALGD